VVIIAPNVQQSVRMMLLLLLDRENVVHPEIQFLLEDRMMMRLYQRNMYRIVQLISQIMSRIIPILMMTFKTVGVDDGKQ
jgi:hypothetical protein